MSYESMFGEDSLGLEKLRLIGLLEREGLTDDIQRDIIRWTEEMETRSLVSTKEMVRMNVDRADLYEALGYIEEMFASLDDALYQAMQEKDNRTDETNWDELIEKIKARISDLENKYPAK